MTVVQPSSLGNFSQSIADQTQDSRSCSNQHQHLSISKWANSNSAWCPSKSIWDREPSLKPVSTTKDRVLTPSNQNIPKPAVAQGLKIETKRDASWPKAASNWTPLTANAVKPFSSQSSSSVQPDKPLPTSTDTRRPPHLSQKTNHLSDSRHAGGAAQYPNEQRYQQPQQLRRTSYQTDHPAVGSNLNERAFTMNTTLDSRGQPLETVKMPWHMAMGGNARQARSAEPVFRQFDEFLPSLQTSIRPHPEQDYTGHATSGWSGQGPQITPRDGINREQSMEPPFVVNNLLGSDSSVSSLTHTFDSTSLNDASSRSSASRQSQESEARYGLVSPLEDRGMMKNMVAEDNRYARQQRSQQPPSTRTQYGQDQMPEWRRGAPNGPAHAGDNWSSPQDMGYINADTRLGRYDNMSNGWHDPRDRYEDERYHQDRREQQYFLSENGLNASAPQIRQPFDNPYMYGLSMDNSTNGYQFMVPAHNLQKMLPVNVYPPRPSVLEIDATQSVRSRLLNEYKTDKQARRWELRDVYDHIVEFCGDQAGSKFIQNKLETANSEERDRVFREILPNACQLMNDVFGNYVMQRFFEHGDQSQKIILAQQMKGKVQSLAKQMYGCRVLQRALKHVLVDQQAELAQELSPRVVLDMIRDQNGNHVIQKVLKRVPWEHTPFVIDTCVQNLQQLAVHNYGCRVIQRLLRHYRGPMLPRILQELHSYSSTLITDQFGNYVTQHMIEEGAPEDRARMIEAVRQNLVSYAKQKFASNVVEKCITCGNADQRKGMMLQLCARDSQGGTSLTFMIKDNYGNYVIQTLLDLLNDEDYATFVAMLEPEIARIRRSLPNKQAENVYKKMQRHSRFPPSQPSPPHGMHMGQPMHQPQQMQHMHQAQRMQSPQQMRSYGINSYPRLA